MLGGMHDNSTAGHKRLQTSLTGLVSKWRDLFLLAARCQLLVKSATFKPDWCKLLYYELKYEQDAHFCISVTVRNQDIEQMR